MSKKTLSLSVELLQEMNVPEAFWPLGRDQYFGSVPALNTAEDYILRAEAALRKGAGLCFYGSADSGKTFLLTYVVRCLAARGFSGHYLTLEEATNLRFDRDGDGGECLRSSKFLALDNVDFTENRGWREVLRQLLRTRKDQHFPFLIGTRLDRESFRSCYGVDTYELVESYCLWVPCTASSGLRDKLKDTRKNLVRGRETAIF